MNEKDALARLRHELANPLGAILAETQLLLLDERSLPPEVVSGLHEIEALALRMRAMLAKTE